MVHSDVLPRPYIPVHRKYSGQASEIRKRLSHLPKRRFSGDRVVNGRSREFTMQTARKIIDARSKASSAVSRESSIICKLKNWPDMKSEDAQEGATPPCLDSSLNSKSTSSDLRIEPANIAHFKEWNVENEQYTLNIRPGRNMFPFIRKATVESERIRIIQDRVDGFAEPLTLGEDADVWRISENRKSFLQIEKLILQEELSNFGLRELKACHKAEEK